jgi:hypothetical protein
LDLQSTEQDGTMELDIEKIDVHSFWETYQVAFPDEDISEYRITSANTNTPRVSSTKPKKRHSTSGKKADEHLKALQAREKEFEGSMNGNRLASLHGSMGGGAARLAARHGEDDASSEDESSEEGSSDSESE